jgi:hypothetical protein
MADTKPPSKIIFHYEKGNFFRVIHVDGAIGGLTPTRDVFLSLYSQRVAIPKIIENNLGPDGNVGAEIKREGKEGIFREMEVGVVLTPAVARQVAEWLNRHAALAEQTSPATPNRGKIQ